MRSTAHHLTGHGWRRTFVQAVKPQPFEQHLNAYWPYGAVSFEQIRKASYRQHSTVKESSAVQSSADPMRRWRSFQKLWPYPQPVTFIDPNLRRGKLTNYRTSRKNFDKPVFTLTT